MLSTRGLHLGFLSGCSRHMILSFVHATHTYFKCNEAFKYKKTWMDSQNTTIATLKFHNYKSTQTYLHRRNSSTSIDSIDSIYSPLYSI